jgi:tetratricopeptide (TPR) repeat protein
LSCHKIEILTKIYKTDEHPQVATTLANIAQQRRNLGDYERAIEVFEKVLGKRRE